ncbi:MAG: vWA domain-containing protein [Candidatus Thermoplasmatota archaeon]|nr:vWA domain-containing protein [Candidatus Thermoplasmatota archaeon]
MIKTKMAGKLILRVRSLKELEALSSLAEKIYEKLEHKTFKRGDKLEIEGIKLRVFYTHPMQLEVTPATTIEISVAPKSADIILAVDSSYSMRKEDYKPSRFGCANKAALTIASHKIGTKDRVGIMSFGYNYVVHSPLAQVSKESLAQASSVLKELKPSGRTAISSAINGAIAMFESSACEKGLKTLTIFTDGFDNIGEAPEQSALKARDKNIIVNTILLGERKEEQEKLLKEIAAITGGSYSYIGSEEEILMLCNELAGKKIERLSSLEDFVELAKTGEKVIAEEGKFKKLMKRIKKKVW